MCPRHPCAHNRSAHASFWVVGYWRHGPTHALRARVPLVVDAPRRSYGYAFGSSRPTPAAWVPLWGHGASNEARHACAELP